MIQRAKKYLSEDQNHIASLDKPRGATKSAKVTQESLPLESQGLKAESIEKNAQGSEAAERVIKKLRGLNINRMTPLQALASWINCKLRLRV